jgi:hypothetical protein
MHANSLMPYCPAFPTDNWNAGGECLPFGKLSRAISSELAGLLSPDHVRWALEWHQRIGVRERVLIGGCGPSIADMVLMTNATQLDGIEMRGLRFARAQKALENFDIVDRTPDDFFSSEDRLEAFLFLVQARNNQGNPLSFYQEDSISKFYADNPEKVAERFKSALTSCLQSRRQLGYWTTEAHPVWGIETCLMIELKRMGVPSHEIALREDNRCLEVQFSWRHPLDSDAKMRSFRIFYGSKIDEFSYHPLQHLAKEYDAYIQKSVERSPSSAVPVLLRRERLKQDSLVIVGESTSGEKPKLSSMFFLQGFDAQCLNGPHTATIHAAIGVPEVSHAPTYGFGLTAWSAKDLLVSR